MFRTTPARLALALLAAAFLLPSAQAQAPIEVTDFSAGPPSGKYSYKSWTPKTLAELSQGNQTGVSTSVVGHLFLPPGSGKVPAVILVHGSGGVYDALLDYWPKKFNEAGIAVYTLDMFSPRGVTSTADDQSQVPFAADVADTFNALKLVATHPRIDRNRIAVMGFSRGGTAALRVDMERIAAGAKLPGGLRFAAVIPTYAGGCTGLFRVVAKPGTFGKAPILFIHGDADDYTPIAPCQDYAKKIAATGVPVEFVVIPGAHHKFDADDVRRVYVRGAQKTKADCPIEVDLDTQQAFDRTTGARLQGQAFQDALASCRATGATVEGNRKARDTAADAAIAFLRKTFAL